MSRLHHDPAPVSRLPAHRRKPLRRFKQLDPERLVLKIDKEINIIGPGPETGLAHEMVGMVRRPDGTIFVNTETQGTGEALGLFQEH